jgi:hypothetical protein
MAAMGAGATDREPRSLDMLSACIANLRRPRSLAACSELEPNVATIANLTSAPDDRFRWYSTGQEN